MGEHLYYSHCCTETSPRIMKEPIVGWIRERNKSAYASCFNVEIVLKRKTEELTKAEWVLNRWHQKDRSIKWTTSPQWRKRLATSALELIKLHFYNYISTQPYPYDFLFPHSWLFCVQRTQRLGESRCCVGWPSLLSWPRNLRFAKKYIATTFKRCIPSILHASNLHTSTMTYC